MSGEGNIAIGGGLYRLTNAGVNIRPIATYHRVPSMHGPQYLNRDFTWSAKPTLE